MNESDFESLSSTELDRIERAIELCGVDADTELKEGGVLEIEFQDGAKIVVNRHRPGREIWVAARSGGFHFRWNGREWRDTREDAELYAVLSRLVSLHSDRGVVLSSRGV